jgi:hypothetical protein
LLKAGLGGGGGERVEDKPLLPKFGYYLDEADPDIVVLRRQNGAIVATFSAEGATKEGIDEAAREDYRALLARKPPSK